MVPLGLGDVSGGGGGGQAGRPAHPEARPMTNMPPSSIGDHVAPRAPFQILIALTATPRFVVLGLQWIAHRYPPSTSVRSSGSGPAASSAPSASTSTYQGNLRSRSKAHKEDDEAQHPLTAEDAGPVRTVAVRPGLVDAEIMFGVARTFCWCVPPDRACC